MDLDLTADQELLAETTRRFLETTCPLSEVRRLESAGGGFEPAYWRQGAELGWTAMLVPEADGGGSVSGDGLLDLVLMAEEIGRMVSPGPLLAVNVVADAVVRRGTPEQRSEVLAPLVAGEQVATWAFAESSSTWDARGVALTATPASGGWSLSGTKLDVEAATVADTFLVTARTGDGLTQFLVPAATRGVTVTPLGSLDFTRRYGRVDFADAAVASSAVLGAVGDAGADVGRQMQVALAVQNAETVGATTVVFEFTLQYAQDRIAFGRPIASYQALKHRFADMRTWLEACHAAAGANARATHADAADASELSSVAKAYIADRCPAIIQDCVQLHGGIGVTWEHDLHLYLRRVAQNAAVYGSVTQHRDRVALLIGMQHEAGEEVAGMVAR